VQYTSPGGQVTPPYSHADNSALKSARVRHGLVHAGFTFQQAGSQAPLEHSRFCILSCWPALQVGIHVHSWDSDAGAPRSPKPYIGDYWHQPLATTDNRQGTTHQRSRPAASIHPSEPQRNSPCHNYHRARFTNTSASLGSLHHQHYECSQHSQSTPCNAATSVNTPPTSVPADKYARRTTVIFQLATGGKHFLLVVAQQV
jgi:hypothetical protein